MTGYLEPILNAGAEIYIRQVAVKVNGLVVDKIKDAFFLSDFVAQDAEGRPIKIFHKHSKVLDNLCKAVTGRTIDETISFLLPFGASHLVKAFRARLERMLVEHISKELSNLCVGQAVETMLLPGYGMAKDAIATRIADHYKTPKPNAEMIALLKAVNLESPSVASSKNTEAEENEEFVGATLQQRTSLKNVLDSMVIDVKEFLNSKIQGYVTEVTAFAAASVAEAGARITYNQATDVAVAATAGLTAVAPAAGAVLGLATYAAIKCKDQVATAAGAKASVVATKLMDTSRLNQYDFITIDRSKSGIYEVTSLGHDIDTALTPEDNSWELVDETGECQTQSNTGSIATSVDDEWMDVKFEKHTLSKFLKENFQELKAKLWHKAQEHNTELAPVPRSFFSLFVDHDLPKLESLREKYKACEEKLFALELELMEVTEYIRGLRDPMTADVLDMWKARIPGIVIDAKSAMEEMETMLPSFENIGNKQRKTAVMTDGNKVLAKLNTNCEELLKGMPEKLEAASRGVREKTHKRATILTA